jgi:hypothetical protein
MFNVYLIYSIVIYTRFIPVLFCIIIILFYVLKINCFKVGGMLRTHVLSFDTTDVI